MRRQQLADWARQSSWPVSGVTVCPDRRRRISLPIPGLVSAAETQEIIDGGIPPRTHGIWINRLQIAQRHDGGHRLTRALHDEALASGSLIEHLAKLRPNLKRGDRSHIAIMAL